MLSRYHIIGLGCITLATAQPSDTTTPKSAPAPIAKTLTDSKGRSIEGTILGRKGNTLLFRRKSDGKELSISVAMLSDLDRAYVTSLPEGVYTSSTANPNTDSKPAGQPAPVPVDITGINNEKMLVLGIPGEKPDKSAELKGAILLACVKFVEPDLKMTPSEIEKLIPQTKDLIPSVMVEAVADSFGYYTDSVNFDGEKTSRKEKEERGQRGAIADPNEAKIEKILDLLHDDCPIISSTGYPKHELFITAGYNKETKAFIVWDVSSSRKPKVEGLKPGMEEMKVDEFMKKLPNHVAILKKPAHAFQVPHALPGGIPVPKDGKVVRLGKSLVNTPEFSNYLKQAVVPRLLAETRRGNKVVIPTLQGGLLTIETAEILNKETPYFRGKIPPDKDFPKGWTGQLPTDHIINTMESAHGVFVTIHNPTPLEKTLNP